MRSTSMAAPGMRQVNTDTVPPRDRFDYWCSLHPEVDLTLADRSIDREAFEASAIIGIGPGDVQFGCAVSANTKARFANQGADRFMISMTLDGSVGAQYGHDGTMVVASESGLVMTDCRRGLRATTQGRHTQLYLAMPREAALAAAGGSPFASGQAVLRMPDAGMTPFLAAHLKLLHTHGPDLSPLDCDKALQVASDLALHCLAQAGGTEPENDLRAAGAYYTAARHFLQRHLGNPDLTAAGVAAALGCSRAHLYRVFALHDATIGDVLRDTRFGHARQLIESRGDRTIGQIAFAVGYKSPAAFSRAFHERYGLSPRDWRQRTGTA